MSRRRGAGGEPPDGEGSFADAADAMGDVVRAEQPRVRVPRRPPTRPSRPVHVQRAAGARFEFPEPGEPRIAHVVGLPARDLARLAGGQPAPGARIDLHGHTASSARRRLQVELIGAADRGVRTVLVIHGRGRHSAAGAAVLREALPDWLTHPPLAERVLAFAPARVKDGGEGATYVLLRIS